MQILLAKETHIPEIARLITDRKKVEGRNDNALSFIINSIHLKLCWIIEDKGNIVSISNGFIFKWFSKKIETRVNILEDQCLNRLVAE